MTPNLFKNLRIAKIVGTFIVETYFYWKLSPAKRKKTTIAISEINAAFTAFEVIWVRHNGPLLRVGGTLARILSSHSCGLSLIVLPSYALKVTAETVMKILRLLCLDTDRVICTLGHTRLHLCFSLLRASSFSRSLQRQWRQNLSLVHSKDSVYQ